MFLLVSACKTNIGKIRNTNEDSLLVNNHSGVFIVADGIGGHKGGEIASEIATRVLGEKLSKDLDLVSNISINKDKVIKDKIKNSINQANNKIIIDGINKSLEGLGTTVVIVKCYNECLYVANLGDSRLYLWNKNNRLLKQVTCDDSLVNDLVKEGKISIEESKIHSQKNIITKYLGVPILFEYDIEKISWKTGDCLLLCSDGLTNMLTDKEIEEIIYNNFSKDIEIRNQKQNCIHQEICDKLILKANEAGGYDNITVVFVENRFIMNKNNYSN